jgi:hypothetical protein
VVLLVVLAVFWVLPVETVHFRRCCHASWRTG